jgi:hypothetical protein
MNWIKTLYIDLGNLPEAHFLLKYILPGLAIFFTWGLAGQLLNISLDKNSLVANKGQVTDIAIKFEQGTRANYKYYPLKINLTNYAENFRLPDTYETDFPNLQEKILIGDTITLYTRHQLQTILGWGKQIDIYQIEKDGQTLFSISKVISEKKNQVALFSIFSLILWTWYILYRRTRKA